MLFKGNDAATPFGPDRVRVLSPGGFQVDISTETSWPIGGQPPSTTLQAFYIGCNGYVGINCNSPSCTLDINGSINASGTINARGFVNSDNLASTVKGLGTTSYISSTGLASTVQGLGTTSYISSSSLISTVQGLGTSGYVSTFVNELTSTVKGLGTAGYMSSPIVSLMSTVQGLGTSSYISSSSLVSTVQGLGTAGYMSSPGAGLVSTVQGLGSSRYISSPIVALSTLSTQSLIAFGESTFLFSSNVYIGNSFSTNILRFYGTTAFNSFGVNQYARTVIAERSFSNDTSELLLFKANNPLGTLGPDNVRVLAAGGFQVDIASNGGVWPINGNPPSTVIRAFTVNSNGYVGIGCNSPRSTLDINGSVNVSSNIFVNGLQVVTFGNGFSSNYVPTSNFLIGASPSTNTIRFLGTNDDGFNEGDKRFTYSAIGERIYAADQQSELLIFKGDNTGCNSWGPDRVRVLSAGGFVVDLCPEGCNWPLNLDPPPALISNAFSIGRDGVIRTASTIVVNGNPVITSGGAGGSIVLSCNVGINCNTPAFTLDVDGVINASSTIYVKGNPVITSGGAGGAIVLSCNVGINCNTPAYSLDVNGCLNVSGCNVAAYQWIAVGTGADKILKSSDGYVWSATSGATFTIEGNRVAWNGSNQWIAVGSGGNTIISSSNGNTWTAVTGPTFSKGNDVVWNGTNLWVAVGVGSAANSIWSSANGTSWTASSTGFASGGYAVATSGSYWVAVGTGGSTAANQKFSTDGITWTNTTGGGGFGSGYGGRGVAFNGSNMWVAVGYGSTAANSILYSTSGGQIWNNAITGGFSSYGTSVTWNGSLWVATGLHSSAAGNIQISLDGMNWLPSLSGAFSGGGGGVVWSGTKFIATGTGTSPILYSDDGRNWSSCNVSGASFTAGGGIGYGRTLTGPLYALTVSGDTFINGTLYINGLPAGAAAGGSGGSGGGGGGGGGGTLPINIELVSSLVGLFGSVGVGCNAPSYSLDVNGTINASSNVFINGSALLAASSLYSTVRGLGSVGYVSTSQLNTLINNSFVSTVQGLGSYGYISSLSNLSNVTNVNSLQGVFSSIGVNCNTPSYSLDVSGTINASSNVFINGSSLLPASSLYSTVTGLGSVGYVSSLVNVNSLQGVFSSIGVNCNLPAYPLDVVGQIRSISGPNSSVGGINLASGLSNVSFNFICASNNVGGNVANTLQLYKYGPNSSTGTELLRVAESDATRSFSWLGDIHLGGSSNNNILRFRGTSGDVPGAYQSCAIGERIYAANENSELLIFKGDGDGLHGIVGDTDRDRVRVLSTGGFQVDIANYGVGNWAIGGAPPSTKIQALYIDANGNSTFGGGIDASGSIVARLVNNNSVWLADAGAERMPAIIFSSNWPDRQAAIGYNSVTNTMIFGFGTNPGAGFLATVTATGFITSSDKTLKENIVDARTNYLDDLNKLRLVNYNRIGKTKKELGFIAQEMEEVFPSVVENNGYDNTKGYAITALIPMVVSAVQSLSKSVSSLQGQIDEIKSANNPPITPS